VAEVVAAADAVAHVSARVRGLLVGRDPDSPVVVAVDGRSGSGKTTLARRVTRDLRDGGAAVTVLHLDHVYPGWDGLSAASQHLGEQLLPRLRSGLTAQYPSWSWVRDRPGPQVEVRPSQVLLVDGVGSGSRASRRWIDLLVWVQAPEPVRHRRAMTRDGDTYAPHWRRWADQEALYLASECPLEHAHVVVTTADGPGAEPRPDPCGGPSSGVGSAP